MLGQKDNLANVIRVVSELAAECLDDRMAFAADEDVLLEIPGTKRVECLEEDPPAAFPVRQDGGPAGRRPFELAVAVAIRLLPINREEVREPRPQVSAMCRMITAMLFVLASTPMRSLSSGSCTIAFSAVRFCD